MVHQPKVFVLDMYSVDKLHSIDNSTPLEREQMHHHVIWNNNKKSMFRPRTAVINIVMSLSRYNKVCSLEINIDLGESPHDFAIGPGPSNQAFHYIDCLNNP